ncbi:MAG: hypothetical protein ABI910_14675 [Gemmatimonadota bacterium]
MRRDEFLHERQQPGLPVRRQRAEQLEVEATAGNGCDGRHFARRIAEHGESATDGFGCGTRHPHLFQWAHLPHAIGGPEITTHDERLEYFLDEERIAFGERMEPRDERSVEHRTGAEDCPEHRLHVRQAERTQQHLGCISCTVEIREQSRQSCADFVAPEREHEGNALCPDRTCQVLHEIQRRLVAPVHVLDRDEERLHPRERADALGQREKETAPVLFRLEQGARCHLREHGAQLRKERHQVGCRRREIVARERSGRGRREHAHQVEHRRVRLGEVRLEARALQHGESRGARALHHVASKT